MTRFWPSSFILHALLPLLLCVPILWALLPGGLPNTADGSVHFIRSAEMVHAWADGVLVPRWAQNLGYGYGIPLFVYAPPLPYQITAALHSLGLPLEWAFRGMLIAGIAIAAYGAYNLSRAFLGVWAGAVGAAAFLYAPIVLRELFIQGNAAQFLAWTFPAWAAWAILRLYACEGRRVFYAVVLALALMGSLLSHNAAALIAMGLIGGLGIWLFLFTRDGRGLLSVVAGSILGLALSAWFWVPALLEGKYVALDRIVASDFRPRFIPLSDLVALSPRLDTGAINPFVPYTWGAVQVWLGALGTLALVAALVWARLRLDRLTLATGLFFILFTAFCGFMATAWSEPVWARLPFVDLFEWPFRWHGFSALGLSWLCAFGVFALIRLLPASAPWITGLALVLLMGTALVNLYPQKLAPGRQASPAEVVRFEIKTSAVGTTSLGEFNPIWVEGTFHTSPLVEDYLAGRPINRLPKPLPPGAHGAQTESTAHQQRFRVSLPAAATLTLNVLYFPGWAADVDGMPAAIRPHPGSGLIDVDLPAGEHTLTLTFGGTPLRIIAGTVSILAWLLLVAVVGLAIRRSHFPRSSSSERPTDPDCLVRLSDYQIISSPRVLPLASVLVVVAAILVVRGAAAGNLQLHSPPDTALPAEVPLHADFEDKLRLLGVDLPPDTVAAGEPLTVVAYWRALQPLDADYSVFLHLDDPVTGETVATVDQMHPNDIPTSGWATGLYVRDPLKLTVPATADPIQYSLRVGVTDPVTGSLLALADGSGDLFEVGPVWVDAGVEPEPPDGSNARFGESIELLGMGYDAAQRELVMYWQADAPLTQEATIFVHLLGVDGTLLGQVDGAPYANRYPLLAWRPGQVIEDRRPLAGIAADPAQIARVAVGVYDPISGVRLPAVDARGGRLLDDALVVEMAALPQAQ